MQRFILLTFAAILSTPFSLWGQKDYKELEAPEPSRKEITTVTLRICRDGTLSNREVLDKYVNSLLARMTQADQFDQLGDLRSTLRYRILQRAGLADDPSVANYLNQKLLVDLRQLTGPEFHPFTRVNATLLLGDLNEKEAPTSGREPAVPLEAGLRAVLELLIEEGQLEGIKAAALVGIDRHCRFGIPNEELRTQVIDTLVGLAQPGQSSSAGKTWLRRRAVRALGHLGNSGEDGKVAMLMLSIVNNPAESMVMRCEAARAVGFLNLRDVKDLKFFEQAHRLGQLVVEAGRKTGPNRWSPEDLQEFQHYLGFIEIGLTGPDLKLYRVGVDGNFGEGRGMLAAMSDGPEKARVQALIAAMESLLRKVFSTRYVPDDEIRAQVDALDDWLMQNRPEPSEEKS